MAVGLPTLLQGVSDRLLGLSVESADAGIAASLRDLGALTGAGRVYVFLLSADGAALDRAFEWCDEGVVGHDFSGFKGVPVTAFPWSMAQFLRGDVIYVRDSAELPAEAEAERGACEALGIGSYVNLPLLLEGRLLGWLGFDSDRPEPGWDDDDIERMRTAGRMLIFTIDRVEREKALRREQAASRRLTALGSFAAGLGHEVNNPLAYVSLNLELLARHIAEGGGDTLAQSYLTDAMHGVERISQTVETLRAFARPRSTDRSPVQVDDVIDSTIKLLRPQIELRARLSRQRDGRAWVSAAPFELSQIIGNIVQNSLQQLREGQASSQQIAIAVSRVSDQVEIAFDDSGPGFSADALARAFEPFFTTRAPQGGSGIGMALCHTVVSGLGGSIAVSNPSSGGARVLVRLPAVAPQEAGAPSSDVASAATGELRVLLVDDEPLLRKALAALLSDHRVVEAENGAQAIEILRDDSRYDVVLCDILMPNGSGRDVFEFVCDQQPTLVERIIFTSGGADQHAIAGFLARVDNMVLRKPIRPDSLLEAIAAVTQPRQP